jgi:serine/threonine protein kinase/tetratricopeptide (TPR) repeat protein
MAQLIDQLQTALAGRYMLERELGRGGGGTVFLASDVRHERNVAIKVLRPEVAATIGVERFLKEIRFAARLQHPHILALHDSGEANGFLYYVMPFVEGESLRERLSREKQLPLEDALRVTREVADALSYAHARGVIHRDIKPENILLQSGHALVADFGIARALDEAVPSTQTAQGVIVGTPVYMSPEQASGGRDVDGRSDVYSLACVLYEMLAGGPPFEEDSLQALIAAHLVSVARPISALRDTVPAHIEAAITKALAKRRADRFATASQFSEALSIELPAWISNPGRQVTPRPTLEGGARASLWTRLRTASSLRWATAIVLVAVLAGAGLFFSPPRSIASTPNAAVLIADVRNTTGDPLFDRSLTEAFTTGIQQSAVVSVFPRSRVRSTLLRMRRSQLDTTLDESLAREVAQREGIRLLIVGDISQIAGTYSLTARIVDPDSGTTLRVEEERARSKAQVLDALDKIAKDLRRDLGESFRSVRTRGLALPKATTSSLEALKRYADGNRAWDAGNRPIAKELWESAIALDTGFALAHAQLGGWYYFNNDRPNGEAHFKRALASLDRLTERERLWIRSKAEGWRGNRGEAINILKILVQQYPDDQAAWFNLGYELMRAQRFRESLDAYDHLLKLDSLHATAYINVAVSHSGLGEYDKAVAAYRKAFSIRPELRTQDFTNHEFGQALIRAGHGQEARANFEVMLQGDQSMQSRGRRSLALVDMLEGRYADAAQQFKEAMVLAQAQKAPTTELRNRLYLVSIYDEQGNRPAMREQLDAVYKIFKSSYIEPGFLLYAGRTLLRGGDIARASEMLDSITRRANPSNNWDQADVSQMRGELALRRGQTDSAVALFNLAYKEQASGVRLASLAEGLERAKDYKGAIDTYRQVERERDVGWEAQETYALSEYRIGRLYETLGDVASAIKAYEAFLDSWKQADPDLRSVKDAKARLERLRKSQRLPLLPRNSGG